MLGSEGGVLLLHDSDGVLDLLPRRPTHLLRAAGSTGHASGARAEASGGGGGGGGGAADDGGPNSQLHRLGAAGPTGRAEAGGSRSGGFGREDMGGAGGIMSQVRSRAGPADGTGLARSGRLNNHSTVRDDFALHSSGGRVRQRLCCGFHLCYLGECPY